MIWQCDLRYLNEGLTRAVAFLENALSGMIGSAPSAPGSENGRVPV